MLSQILLFAAVQASNIPDVLQPEPPPKIFGLSVRDLLLLLGVVAIIGLTLFLLVYLNRHRRQSRVARASRIIETSSSSAKHDGRRRRRKRRSHSDTWGRNPTLGQTGGLPPVRSDGPAEPVR
jgi:hypothetical protein